MIRLPLFYRVFAARPFITNKNSLAIVALNPSNNFSPIFDMGKTLTFSLKCSMAKKKEDKDVKKKKQKQKIKEEIGGDVTEIDLNKYQQPYKRIVQNYKVFLSKCRAGKIDANSFDDIEVRIGKQKFHVQNLAQIAPKNNLSVVINPYDSDNLDAIEKSIKAADDSLQILKIDKSLSVSLPNSSIKELKGKMIEKIKKALNDQKQFLKKQRHICHEDLKKYEKIAQKDKLKQIQKQSKQLYEKYNQMLEKMMKQKQKQLLK